MVDTSFLGWLVDPGPPFEGALLLPFNGISKVLIGPNGYGKSLLLEAIRDPATIRLFRSLPPRLRDGIAASQAERAYPDASATEELSSSYIAEIDAHQDRVWGLQLAPDGRGLINVLTPQGGMPGDRAPMEVEGQLIRGAIERWVVPDSADASSLDARTGDTFAAWLQACLDGVDGTILRGRNMLVGRLANRTGVSLLRLAEAFAEVLAERTGDRVAALVGFRVEVRVQPDDDFSYQIKYGREWFPLEEGSSALRRWVGLAASETLWEIQRVAEEAGQFARDRIPVQEFLLGTLPPGTLPSHDVEGFVSKSSWIMLDEPEIHLFGSEVRSLGKSLARISNEGRLYIASHSVELASHLVGKSDFLAFSSPGVFDTQGPQDWLNTQLATLAAQGTGALSTMRVLYVEGNWDVTFMEHLFGAELREHRIVLCPTNGTLTAGSVATSVWQRMTSAPFGVMFDSLNAKRVHARWREVLDRGEAHRRRTIRALRAEARTGSFEARGLAQLQANLLETGMESRVLFVMHGLSDIFQVASPRAFGADADTWEEAGYTGEGFKEFVRTNLKTDLSEGRTAQRIFDRVRDGGGVEVPAMLALDGEFRMFLDWCSKD